MLDVAWTEYLLIVVVALVLLGPKELPVVLRTVGRWVAKARHMASNLEHQLYSLEDKSQMSSFVKDKTQETTLFNYQRVFLKQHQSAGQIHTLEVNPLPKPWL